MAIIQNIILGLVQGLSEFLPISSSGHLLMFMNWFNFETNNMIATIMFHIGTLLSVVVYYFRDLLSLFKKENWGYILKLGIATLPAVVVALVAGDSVDSVFTSKYLWITFLITALLLYIAQRQQKYCVYKKEVGFLDSLIMGIMQAVAIVPGISRSGSTICGGVAKKALTTAIPQTANKSSLLFVQMLLSMVDTLGCRGFGAGVLRWLPDV